MRKRGIAAPVFITVVVLLVLIAYLIVYASLPMPVFVKILIGIVIAALCGVAIFVLIERIKEIRSGENDDLGKY